MDLLTGDRAAGTVIAARDVESVVAVDECEPPAVHRAARALAADLARVCGARPRLASATRGTLPAGTRVVVGTLGVGAALDEAVARGDFDAAPLEDADGRPLWEGYTIQEARGVVYVAGADRRGTVYGVYELCEQAGVSPWHWFADVPVRTREHVTVRAGARRADHPSVRYRGIFINDEEELDAWARAHTADGTIGPETYERVFELLLRLKGNLIWPAMHVGAFNADPRNGALAEDMGVIVGTSHCDMLLRSNQNEWGPWLAARDEPVEYDYSIPGRNRVALREYWRGSVEQNREYEAGWNVGIRGIHDTGFVTSAIDSEELSEAERTRARVELLGRAITDQCALLDDVLGPDPEHRRLTTFVPYKEVLPLYDAGLEVPEDVTVIWADDNFGHMRRYPTAAELTRRGGHGLYYHSSYWSQPPRSYLFIGSTPLAQMRTELRTAWDRGIRTLWIDNVGAIKPLEQDVEYFLRYAWQVGKETTTTDDVADFTAGWVNRTFTGGHGARVARILTAHMQIVSVRKVEHLAAGAFSQTGYGDEAGRRLARLRELFDEVNDVMAALPVAERDAFFQLVAMKVHAAYLSNAEFVFADRSALAYDQGKLPAADHYLALSRYFVTLRRAMLRHYNTVMSGGKWDGICTPESFPPPTTAMYPAARPALRIGAAHLGVVVWGDRTPVDAPRLTFSTYGRSPKWIEVFPTGAGGVDFEITADEWIHVSKTRGHVDVEERVQVWVDDPRPGVGTLVVYSPTDGRRVLVEVAVEAAEPAGPDSWVEADGYVSIRADLPDVREEGAASTWETVRHLGRGGHALVRAVSRLRAADPEVANRSEASLATETNSAARADRTDRAGAPAHPGAKAARLGYRLHLATAGAHLLELHRAVTLSSLGRIRAGVGVDDLPPVVIESPTTDEKRGNWWRAVVEDVEKLTVRLPYLPAGEHTLWLHAVDEDVAFSRLVVYTGPRQETTLGPPTSARTGDPAAVRPPAGGDPADGRRRDVTPGGDAAAADPDPAPGDVDLPALEAVRREVYRVETDDLPLPRVVYVDPEFWSTDTTFTRPASVAQERFGPARFTVAADGTKDWVAQLGTGPVREHDGVVAIEAARALIDTADAYTTPSLNEPAATWTHTQSESGGGTGLAMHVDAPGRYWADPAAAPGLHVRIELATPGTYHAWALVKFDSRDDDSVFLAVDGTPLPLDRLLAGGDLYAFGTQQIWSWQLLTDVDLTAGQHTVSVLARKAGLRLDRLYLTLHDERPPVDEHWPSGDRTAQSKEN